VPDPQPLSRRSRRTHHGEVGDGDSRQSLELVIGDAHRHAVRPGLEDDPLVLAEREVDL
jgi:hypothetical protein